MNIENRITGAKDLIFDAIEETTNLVEQMHRLAARNTFRPLALIEPVATVSQAVKAIHDTTASGVYQMIRTVNTGVRKLLDASTGLVVSGLSQSGKIPKTRMRFPKSRGKTKSHPLNRFCRRISCQPRSYRQTF